MASQQHILVIRLSAMGDVAMTVPVLRGLTQKYPDLEITFLTKPFFAPILSDVPNLRVHEAEVKGSHQGIMGLWRLSQTLYQLKLNGVADFHDVLRSNVLAGLLRVRGIPARKINKGRREKRALTRSRNKIFKKLKGTHERYADVFEALGFPVSTADFSTAPPRELSEQVLNRTGPKEHKWVGIAPFAQHQSKTYPPELMDRVLEKINKNECFRVFLFSGGSREAKICAQWEEKYENIIPIAGIFSFDEEISLISNLDVMLSMDSGNGHLASNFGIPVVTLWGLTHPFAGFAPYDQPEENSLLPDLDQYPAIPTSIYGKTVLPGYEQVMETISPETVVSKIEESLRKRQ